MMYYRYYNRLDILSFPTRRSSDLDELLTVFDPERHKRQLHGHTDEQLIRIGYRQSRLHPHLAGQFDVTDAIWFKRSEEHTSELQSRGHLVCRLQLEKKNLKQQSTL